MTLYSDLRFALRQWRKNRIATAAAIVTLALGTGVNTAIFSVIHTVMIKPLPYPQPERLVQVWSTDLDAAPSDPNRISSRVRQVTPLPVVDRWRESSRFFEDLGGYRPWMVNLVLPQAEPERVRVALISAGFFRTLRNPSVKGRLFAKEEFVEGRDRVVVLSDAAWRTRFSGDPSVLGRAITINGAPFTIIGILPPDFQTLAASIGDQPEMYQPMTAYGGPLERTRSVFLVGRLRSGATIRDAGEELSGMLKTMGAVDPRSGTHGVRIAPLSEEIAGELAPALMILFGATGCVLLIACGNLANLMLASTSARQREIALRSALGASRSRNVMQVFTESLALSITGSACGLLLSLWGAGAMVSLYPQSIPRMNTFHLEPAIFIFAACIAAITALLFGAFPALRYSRPNVQQVLKDSSISGTRRRGWTGNVLVAGQVAVALVLLIGAGLLMRGFILMRAIAPGFERKNLLIAHMTLDSKTYRTGEQQASFVHRLLERVHTLPGVESAAVTNSMPLDFNLLLSMRFRMESRPELGEVYADTRTVSADYFHTLGIPLVKGRFLDTSDVARNDAVAANRSFARKFFGDSDPIGRRLLFSTDAKPLVRTIVGVVADVKNMKIERATASEIYLPFDSQPVSFVDVAVRTSENPRAVVGNLRDALRAVDPNQPLGTVTTMDAVLENSVAKPRWYALLIGSFAGLALLLAAIGVYGVVACSVNRRTAEIGIRMAIGAARRDVLLMVIRESLTPALCGLVIGIPAAIAASKVLASYLYGVELLDVRTYIFVALLVPVVTVVAALLPARRAATVDPLIALRHE